MELCDVTDEVLIYRGMTGRVTSRRAQVITGAGLHPVVLALEGPRELGTSMINAAREVLTVVHDRFPGHAVVVHYDREPRGSAWAKVWTVMSREQLPAEPGCCGVLRDVWRWCGRRLGATYPQRVEWCASFDRVEQHPEVLATLQAAGVR